MKKLFLYAVVSLLSLNSVAFAEELNCSFEYGPKEGTPGRSEISISENKQRSELLLEQLKVQDVGCYISAFYTEKSVTLKLTIYDKPTNLPFASAATKVEPGSKAFIQAFGLHFDTRYLADCVCEGTVPAKGAK